MKMRASISTGILALALFAASSATAGIGARSARIVQQGVGDGGEYWYVFVDSFPDGVAPGCANKRFVLLESERQYQVIVSTLLAGGMAGASVRFTFDDTSCSSGSYRLIGARVLTPAS